MATLPLLSLPVPSFTPAVSLSFRRCEKRTERSKSDVVAVKGGWLREGFQTEVGSDWARGICISKELSDRAYIDLQNLSEGVR